MWKVLEEKSVEKQLSKAPKEVLKAYQAWKAIAETEGPMGLYRMTGFRDHTLKGEWAGARSSYLNKKWRVIYFVKAAEITIIVLEVNAHDYRKKS